MNALDLQRPSPGPAGAHLELAAEELERAGDRIDAIQRASEQQRGIRASADGAALNQ